MICDPNRETNVPAVVLENAPTSGASRDPVLYMFAMTC